MGAAERNPRTGGTSKWAELYAIAQPIPATSRVKSRLRLRSSARMRWQSFVDMRCGNGGVAVADCDLM